MPIRVLFAGATGKVGRAIVPLLAADPRLEYAGGVARGEDLSARLSASGAHALVDFTEPDSGLANALAAVAAGAVPVIGTSGIPEAGVEELEAACRARGIGGIVAPNFAVGAVAMMWLAEKAAPLFDSVEVIEAHAQSKLDAPSGTAVATARRLAAARGRAFDHNAATKVVLPNARGAEHEGVAVHSLRLPGLVADQQVLFGSEGQTLSIEHRTTSREAYAPGVILAITRLTREPAFHRGLESLLGLT